MQRVDKACSFVIATGLWRGRETPCAVRGRRRPFQPLAQIPSSLSGSYARQSRGRSSRDQRQHCNQGHVRVAACRRRKNLVLLLPVRRLLRQKQVKVTQTGHISAAAGLKEWRDLGRSSALVHLPLAIRSLEIRIRNFQIRGNRDQ